MEPDDVKLYVLVYKIKNPTSEELRFVFARGEEDQDIKDLHLKVQAKQALLNADDRPKELIFMNTLAKMLEDLANETGGEVW